ncbi:pentapeptide repeat-containing protein [Clostridium sp.]|uniref:pentapeptide repeat-containing protein n=1 Tax=Clostridium sp. TaxID=1506 RepID=UPI003464C670
MPRNSYKYNKELFENFKIDCEKCFGFCCVALYFSASEGFPTDKVAGKPCINLKSDFTCSVHKDLRKQGLKGCTAYDCFGAGQKVAQLTYKGKSWKDSPKLAKQMFDVFLVMRQLHEMLWYLTEASMLEPAYNIKEEINLMIKETEEITNSDPQYLIDLDIVAHRDKVNILLRQTSELVKKKFNSKDQKALSIGVNLIGKNLKKTNLIGADLRGALLIAADLSGNDLSGANLIGADMRDTDIRGANLKNSIFLTQSQINTAKGDNNTKLPDSIVRPTYWEK